MVERETRITPEEWAPSLADTDGYQMVVAGPGTGKTEFLVRRVQYLIDSGLARRDEVVVLCFSRRASADISRRIEKSVGVTGVPVDTTTFHSLALRLIETATDGTRLIPLTTPEQVGVVAKILETEDPAGWPITYRGILSTHAFAVEVADFLMRCSERLLKPSDLAQRAKERADWRGLPGLYQRYLEHLSETGRTDYGMLLTSAVDLMASKEGRSLLERFHYVLVDEYQDTSPAQARMADLIASTHGNLTVAGDPYQSIYSFRGAELRNVADFTERHRGATRTILSQSMRVPAGILDSALRVVSGGELPGAAGPVEPAAHEGRTETYVFDQETAEAEWIAREVEHSILVDSVDPGAIAILVRSKKELIAELSRALDRRGVAHDPPDSRLVDHPAVRLFADLCTVAIAGGPLPMTSPVEAADADRAMRRILLGPMVGLGLGQERAILRARRRTWAAWPHVMAQNLPHLEGLTTLLHNPEWATSGSAVDGFWRAWNSIDGLEEMIADSNRAEWRRAWTAFAQVLTRQAERDPNLDLARFFELTEDEGFEATPLISHRLNDNRVTLTTLHQAKGLEFDIVFIANAVEGVFPDLRRSRRMLRPELLSPERTTDPQAQHLFQLQEEMRLAYTAMTRARLRVVWTATDAGIDQGDRRPSRFIVAASQAGRLQSLGPPPESVREPITVGEAETSMRRDLLDASQPAVRRLAALTILASPRVESGAEWWDPNGFAGVAPPGPDRPLLGDRFKLSPSQADAYQRCPRRYALERRLRLGGQSTPWAHFGTLIHAALEKAEREVIGTGRQHADLPRAIEHLASVWVEADFGSPELNEAWFGKGREALTKLYEEWPHPDGTPIDVERQVDAVIDGVVWIGFIDRLEQTPEGIRVVDYKTSTSAVTIAEAASSIQLAFYASTVENDGEDVVQAQFWYPRVTGKALATRDLDLDLLDQARNQMTDITVAIRAEDWEPKVGDQCRRCDFRLSCPAWPEGRGAYLP
ncbi:MAG: ATP-dependent DNA helicase [Acidimicrobiia bacterium]